MNRKRNKNTNNKIFKIQKPIHNCKQSNKNITLI